ncbi:hypothetical protein Syun_011023 [Stephania yunnanensis]|uniref:Expansin-like EG45 domain-containing protein n=1 Tax=Stephania yunnanensis TaxID=152371 RepID=A0AAP0PE26_9MAGN
MPALIAKMLKDLQLLLFFGFFISAVLLPFSNGDVGTASLYQPPYLPTACYGNDVSQFPSNNLFAAASEGIWDNGASCGRQYQVRCLSSTVKGACLPDQIIVVTIVDRAASAVSTPPLPDTTMVLANNAYSMIANPSVPSVNIEFRQA